MMPKGITVIHYSVPETSVSVSETLGNEDTPSSSNCIDGKTRQIRDGKKSFASLFHDNLNPSKGNDFAQSGI